MENLPLEIFYCLLNKLEMKDLLALRTCCKKFKAIVDSWLELLTSNSVLINFKSKQMKTRWKNKIPSALEKHRLLHNWKNGKYLLYDSQFKGIGRPWMENESSENHLILAFNKSLKIYNKKLFLINPLCENTHPFTRFRISTDKTNKNNKENKKKNVKIYTGDENGCIRIWDVSLANESVLNAKSHLKVSDFAVNDLELIEENKKLVVYGTHNGTYGVCSTKNHHKKYKNKKKLIKIQEMQISERIWCLSHQKNSQKIAIGSKGSDKNAALTICDINTNQIVCDFDKSYLCATFQIKWMEDENLLFSCGHDALIKKWDLRVKNAVQVFKDPMGESVYCLDSDGTNTLVSGAQRYGRISFWDVRMKHPIQNYFLLHKNNTLHSPVYSVWFDVGHIYAAADIALYKLDFTTRQKMPVRDYRYNVQD